MKRTEEHKKRVVLPAGTVVYLQGVPVVLEEGTPIQTTLGNWSLILRLQAEEDQEEAERRDFKCRP